MMTFEKFYKDMSKSVQETFNKEGGMPPTWLFLKEDEVAFAITHWEGFDEKESITQTIKAFMKENNVQAYLMFCESWMASVPVGVGMKTHKDYKGPPPSERPDRMEVLMMVGGDQEGNCVESMMDIIRDQEGKAHIEEFKIDVNKYKFQGRFTNLLREEH